MNFKILLKIALCISSLHNISAYMIPNALHYVITKQYKCDMNMNMNLKGNEMNRRKLMKNAIILTGLNNLNQFAFFNKKANAIDENNIIKLYEKILPSVCYISTEYMNMNMNDTITNNTNQNPNNPFTNQSPQKGIGTGFFWDDKGHIVTNFHVINKVDKAVVYFTNKNNEYKEVNCKLTGVDPDRDIAVLKIDTNVEDYACIQIGTNNKIKIGQYAFAIGNPFSQNNTLTMGIVSGLNRKLTAPSGKKIKNIIQTDASINPGNSGGPLLDSSGKLIGMNTASMGMGVSSGVNFAVSVDMIKETVDNIIKYGTMKKPIIGITYLERSPTRDEAEKANVPYIEKGVIVLNAPDNLPASNAGIKGMNKKVYGDIIIGIDNIEINDVENFNDALDKYKPNDKILIKTLRGIEKIPMEFEVTLGEMDNSYLTGLELDKK